MSSPVSPTRFTPATSPINGLSGVIAEATTLPSASIISTRYASATATKAVWLTSTTTSPKKPASTVSVVLASGEPAAGEPSVKPSTWKSLSLTGAFTMAVCAPNSMSLLSV